jgi:radical SAM protein with 4Fe4S-binding SPASM domain
MHSTRGADNDLLKQSGFEIKHMDSDVYAKTVNDLTMFPVRPKLINFCGIGEPLMNPKLGNMIRELRSAGFNGRIITYTNGAAFTPEKLDDLVEAGMTEFRISVNGLTSEQYKKNTGVAVDMSKYVDNIRYLYEHKKGTRVYVKIVSNIFTAPSDEQKFYDMFGGICDNLFVEHLVTTQQQMGDYGGIIENHTSIFGEKVQTRAVCACMFYQLHIDCDGNVFVCISLGKPASDSIGNIRNSPLAELWSGAARDHLLKLNLERGSDAIPFCVDCGPKYDINTSEEYLDDCRGELLQRLESKL